MQPRIKKSELSAVEYTIPDQSTRSFRVIYKWRITRVRGGRLKREGAGLINFLPRKRRALIRERGKDTREKKDRRKKFLVSLPRLTLHFSPSLLSFRLTLAFLTSAKKAVLYSIEHEELESKFSFFWGSLRVSQTYPWRKRAHSQGKSRRNSTRSVNVHSSYCLILYIEIDWRGNSWRHSGAGEE